LSLKGAARDQEGTQRIGEGEALNDGDLHGMDWYVDGVQT